MAYKGKDVKTYFFDGSVLTDLSSDTADSNIEFVPELTSIETYGKSYMQRIPVRSDVTHSLASIYYGDAARAVREAAESATDADNSVMYVHTPWGVYAGGVMPEGMGLDIPFADVVSVSADMAANGAWYYGSVIGSLASLTATYANLPSEPADAAYDVIVALVETANDQSVTWHISDSGSNRTAEYSADAGIYIVDDLPDAPTRIKTTAAPSGTVKITLVYVNAVEV